MITDVTSLGSTTRASVETPLGIVGGALTDAGADGLHADELADEPATVTPDG